MRSRVTGRAGSSAAERSADNGEAGGSIPPRRMDGANALVAQTDEPRPTKPEDEGSNPSRCAVTSCGCFYYVRNLRSTWMVREYANPAGCMNGGEGEAPAEPHRSRRTRLGRSLALPAAAKGLICE